MNIHHMKVSGLISPTSGRRAPFTRVGAWLAAAACVALLAAAAPLAGPPGRWDARLARLDPLRPIEYLELGEEIADAATNDDERLLARQLFGLAGALDQARVGRSAMLAIAGVARSDSERARALAAAELVGGRADRAGGPRSAIASEPKQLESLSRALSFHRRGEGRRALNALKQDDADALLEAVGPALAGEARVFREECKALKPGSEPPNDAWVIRRGLLVEHALRSGDLRTPGLDLILNGDAPLIEIDLGDPQSIWGVDPRKPWWRGGRWSGNG